MTNIRDFTIQDGPAIMQMVTDFYTSPATLHPIPPENFQRVYEEMCGGGSERLRGLAIEHDGKLVGYTNLSFTYSTEAGGPVVLIEEVYLSPAARGLGLGSEVFEFIKNEYRGKAARLRLEVAPENSRAKQLYERLGFEELPYIQMIMEDL